jgi:hypothetical protein
LNNLEGMKSMVRSHPPPPQKFRIKMEESRK